MFKRSIPFLLAFAWLDSHAAFAAEAQDCPPLKMVTSVDMLSRQTGLSLIPLSINDTPRLFLLDTGGFSSQLSPTTAKELNLPLYDSRAELHDASGNTSHRGAFVDKLTLGSLTATHVPLMVSPSELGVADGLLSSDLLVRYDIEMDFGAHKLSYFSPDHCPGKVVHWPAQEIAVIPLTLRDRSRILVDVKLEGKAFRALVDTGATRSTITKAVANSIFGLDSASPGMMPAGPVNGDPRLQSYRHTFSSLTFEGVAVTNPTLLVMPDHIGGSALQTGSHISGDPNIQLPEFILGMDILRHLHLYLAFQEQKLYVSASAGEVDSTAAGRSQELDFLDKAIALSPTNASLLNNRCFQRGVENVKLEAALEDCEASLHAAPSRATTLDSKAFILYRLGRFPEALTVYNDALKLDSKLVSSLYMRGQTKRKLGDSAGADADITAAKAIDAGVIGAFHGIGFSD
jgi:predicted aspartyl protease